MQLSNVTDMLTKSKLKYFNFLYFIMLIFLSNVRPINYIMYYLLLLFCYNLNTYLCVYNSTMKSLLDKSLKGLNLI